MSDNKDGDLQSKYEFNSTWAERIAFLIIVGLAIEIVAVFILKKSFWEGALTIAANVLIVAGVWGEILFEKRAKAASDGIVAQANARAKEADARAAEAHVELARLEKKMIPRAITIDGETSIIDALKSFPEIPFSVQADPAAEYGFINRLITVLQRAGWVWLQYSAVSRTLAPGDTGFEPRQDMSSGVQVRINRSQTAAFFEPAKALGFALTEALGLSVPILTDPAESPNACSPDMVHIEIVRKI